MTRRIPSRSVDDAFLAELAARADVPADPAAPHDPDAAPDPDAARAGARERIVVEDAMTGLPMGTVPHGAPEDVAEAAACARAAQPAWAALPVTERAAVLLRFHDLVLERQAEVLDLIQRENGKARRHAFEEVLDVAMTARYYARAAARLLRPVRRQGALPLLTRTRELHHPKGVIGVISPWNYPLTLGVSDALPALVAGNAVLSVPDAGTPFSLLWAARLLEEAGLPRGVLQVVTGHGAELGDSVIRHADFLMFTGSTAVGREVAAGAGRRLIESSLELGGKNPLLVLEDADPARAARGAVRACFSNTGQLCISVERIYVPDALWAAFTAEFLSRTRALRLSAALDWSGQMGSLSSARQLETVTRHVEDARRAGATVLTGGRPRPDLGPWFYEPTVLTGLTPEMEAYGTETFGPVVALYRVADDEEAVRRANEGAYGLNASVWTSDPSRGRRVAARLRTGTVNVNDAYAAAWASLDAPMGGMRESGLGRRHGAHGLLKYTDAQTVAVQHLMPVGLPDAGPVLTRAAARVSTAGLRLLRRTPGIR